MSVIKQDIYGIIPGETYNFSFWAFGWNLYGSLAARAYVWWINASGYPVGYPDHIPALTIVMSSGGVSSYTKFSGTTTPAPPQAAFAEIQFGRYSWGGVIVDDVQFLGPHDTGITNVTLSKTVVGMGYPVSINVTVKNRGNYPGVLNVTVYVNTTSIALRRLTLESGASTTLTFTWNTSGFVKGNYTISAYAESVLGETDTTDNTLVGGVVHVGIPGDIDAGGKMDIKDIFIIAKAFGSHIGESRYNPNADINSDGKVDINDIFIVAKNFGKTDP